MTVWIVECSVCRKSFEREAVLMPVSMPPVSVIPIYPHGMLNSPTVPCPGAGWPGIGMGSKAEYEREKKLGLLPGLPRKVSRGI